MSVPSDPTNPELEEAVRLWRAGASVEERVVAFRYIQIHSRYAAHQLGVALWGYAVVRSDHVLIDATLVALGEDTIRLSCRNFERFIEAHPARGWAEILPRKLKKALRRDLPIPARNRDNHDRG